MRTAETSVWRSSPSACGIASKGGGRVAHRRVGHPVRVERAPHVDHADRDEEPEVRVVELDRHRVDRRVIDLGRGVAVARVRLAVLEAHRVDRRDRALRELRAVHLREPEGAPRRRRVRDGIQHVDVERPLEHAQVSRHPDREPAVLGLDPLAHVVREVRGDQACCSSRGSPGGSRSSPASPARRDRSPCAR